MRSGAQRAILQVSDLVTTFETSQGEIDAVDGVTFNLEAGKTLAIVGESGSGKSQLALSILGLLERNGRIKGGEVAFLGEDLTGLPEDEMRTIRGSSISIIFQDPLSALNPVFKVGRQLVDVIHAHQEVSKARAWRMAEELLDEVGIPHVKRKARSYPSELSGGERQRAMIAMAIANRPEVLIADEPTTALDVTTQAEVLDLLSRLQATYGMAIVLISHDLAVVAQLANHVCVMYAGRIVESAGVGQIFHRPAHPYTMGLLASVPRIDRQEERFHSIEGSPPSPYQRPQGCPFWPRCRFARDECKEGFPSMKVSDGQAAACVLSSEERERARREVLGGGQ